MNIAVIGTGYVGLTQGAVLAEIGNQVTCVDIDSEKIANLKKGSIGFYEPGLDELVERNVAAKRLRFTNSSQEAIEQAEVIYSAVGTPPDKNHKADLSAVLAVSAAVGKYANGDKIFINKSTVPVGTGELCEKAIAEVLQSRGATYTITVVSNPEFLREGVAVQDCLKPDRIVVGTDSEPAKEVLRKINKPIIDKGSVFFATDRSSAEIIKYAANALLATKISFMNEIAQLCERVGGDVTAIEHGVGLDTRIGRRFLHAGIGYGGSCFPKDIAALVETGRDHGYDFKIISAAQEVNTKQRQHLADQLQSHMGNMHDKTISLWGLSFKPKTSDMREAPALYIIQQLLDLGAAIRAFDPVAIEESKTHFSEITYCNSAFEAAEGSDALLLLTDWDEFRSVDFSELKKVMNGNIIGDGRNIWNPDDVRRSGFTYFSIGRK